MTKFIPTNCYALREKKTGKMVGYDERMNTGDMCNDTTVELSMHSSKVWTCSEAWRAEWVKNTSTEWYNSSLQTPKHGFDIDPDEFEVVKYTITIEIQPLTTEELATIPTNHDVVEYSKKKYSGGDAGHIERLVQEGHVSDSKEMLGGKGCEIYNLSEMMGWPEPKIKTEFLERNKKK